MRYVAIVAITNDEPEVNLAVWAGICLCMQYAGFRDEQPAHADPRPLTIFFAAPLLQLQLVAIGSDYYY